MAFKHRNEFTQEPQSPSNEILAGMELDKDQIHYNVSQIKKGLLYHMGIDIDQAGFNRDEKGNLRLFEITPDGEIVDPLDSCPVVSGEFLEKIQQGRIFGFPAGEEHPIQMQVSQGELKASRPIENSPIPMPKSPPFWMRLANSVFGAYKKEIGEFEAAKAKCQRVEAALDETKKSRSDILKEEEDTYLAEEGLRQGEEQEREEGRRLNKLRQLDGPPEKYKGQQEEMLDNMQEIYGTEPVMHDEFVGSRYTLDQFAALKSYDIRQMEVNGPISERDFMAVSMINAMSPELGGQARLHEGVPAEMNAMSGNSLYTTDLSREGKLNPREGCGNYFPNVVGPARDGAVAAIRDYQKGNPEKLGHMIGQGIHVGESMLQHSTADKKDFVAVNGLIGQAAKLLDRDPELMKAAKEAGMTDADLEMARGDAKYLEIINKNEWATERLRAADSGEIQLSDQERRECINTRLAFEVLNQEIAGELAEQDRSEKAAELSAELAQESMVHHTEYRSRLQEIQKLSDGGSIDEAERLRRVAEAKGNLEEKLEQSVSLSVPKRVAALGQPEIFRILGTEDADKTIESMVDYHLPGRDKLYDLKGPELENALDSKNLFADKSPYRVPEAPEKGPEPAPRMEKQPEKQPEKQREQKALEKTRELTLEM